MKKYPKLPYKNHAWDLGLKTKKEQELFFEIENNACSKVYGDYYNHGEIIKVLMALIHNNIQMGMVGAIFQQKKKQKKNSKKRK